MLILSLAAGTQLFVEPQLVSQASFGVVSNDYSVNQLAYQYAFTQNNFNGAAAISIDLLIVALACAGICLPRPAVPDRLRRLTVSVASVNAARRGGTAGAAAADPGRLSGRTLAFLLLALFLLFFLIPIVWLLLAVDQDPARRWSAGNPFSFGSLSATCGRTGTSCWPSRTARSRPGCGTRSIYSLLALVITLVVSIPAGYALAKMEFRGRRLLLITTLVVMLMPTAALVLPTFLEINYAHLVNTAAGRGPAVLVLPVRGLPDLHLLLHRGAERPDRRGEDRRLRRAVRRSSGSRCRWPRRWSRWSASSASWATGTTSSCPT